MRLSEHTYRTISTIAGPLLFVEKVQAARIGEKIWVVPSHVCPTVNLHDEVWYGRKGQVDGKWIVAARGKVR